MSKSLDYITHYFTTQIGVGSQVDVWMESNMDLPDVGTLANECRSGLIYGKMFKKYPISVVVGLLKLYLFELPVSLCSYVSGNHLLTCDRHDIYEPLKLLYLSSKFLNFEI